MKKKKILVIGGCGFIGRNLLEEFAKDRRYSVVVFDRPEAIKAAAKIGSAVYVPGNFDSRSSLEGIFRRHRIDTVVHLVSTTVPASSDGFAMVYDIETNLVPTVRLLCLMEKYKARRIIFASSGGTVYGPGAGGRAAVSESCATNPICSHGTVKLAIEKYIQLSSYLHGLEYLILRISNPYGEHHSSRVQGLINVALRNMAEGRPVRIWGDGRVVRDYIYVKDCVRAVKRLMDAAVSGEIVNVGSGRGHSVNEVLRMLRKVAGELRVERRPGRKFDVPRVVLNVSRLKALTGFVPTPLEAGIRKTFEWLSGGGGR
ncbi:MAG: NAD-dependent epimerase/dehydratase family protein [Elusimicrobia bacterium]|nr:NAD-dependent epimerase/dehydratase family protein [Elusimicrobiota bacterium]